MAIQRYSDGFGDQFPSPGSSFSTMLDRFFKESMTRSGGLSRYSPHVDAYETERSYELEASLPGLKREDIKVEFQQGRLTRSGERRSQSERNERRYHLIESQYGSFNRSFQLPDVADAQHIEVRLENGILHVSVPKNEEKTKRHQIEVRGSQAGPSKPGNGHLPERMGQQATDVPVESGQQKTDGQTTTSA